METSWFMLLVLLTTVYLLQGLEAAFSLDENMVEERRLKLINKPAVKTFVTKNGDILDCVEIHKQLAFDHPLLKNHSIQMVPSINVSEWTSKSSGRSHSRLLPKNMRCPQGTVPIRRIKEEDLALEKFSSLLGKSIMTSNSSNFAHPNDNQNPPGHHAAVLMSFTRNTGVVGEINVWSPDVKPDQFSDASIFAASDDGSVSNAVVAGWMVNPYLYQNFARLYTYWTKDSGQTTGCFDLICPGFIQVSETLPVGVILRPVSIYGGAQTFITVSIKQDPKTMNWWFFVRGEGIGYWPTELFSNLTHGATRAGWGGEIFSPVTESAPAMGSGHFPNEGYKKACAIAQLNLFGADQFPKDSDLKYFLTKPDCYKVLYGGDAGGDWGHYMFFGGPPDCKLWEDDKKLR